MRTSYGVFSRHFSIVAVLIFVTHSAAFSAVIRVKPGGNDASSGASWALAKATVQAAIDAAAEGDEIWVAAGTYPQKLKNKVLDEDINPVPVNVALYGGFAGTETTRDQRDWSANLTVLQGLGGTPPSPPEVGSVVHITGGAGRGTRVDGFVITNGSAIGGGGILIEGSGPTVVNNTIWQNRASIGGGIAIVNYDFVPPTIAHPVVTDNKIHDNSAGEGGGGIAVIGSERLVSYAPAAPVISRNVISQNTSSANGGGIGCFGHTAASIANNQIVANAAADSENNFYNGGGGIFATSRDVDDQPISFAVCAPSIVNNAIAANGGFLGAGIYCRDTDSEHGGVPSIINNTVVSNNGIGIYWTDSVPVIANNIVAFNAWGLTQPAGSPAPPGIRANCVYGNSVRGQRTDYNGLPDQTGLNGNISIDPLLANIRIGDIRLQPGSACVDAGDSASVSSEWKDIQGEDRVQGNGVDIGADESDGTAWNAPTPVIRVRPDGDDAEDGTTWAKAKRTVGAGIQAAYLGGGGEVWVAAGTYGERNILQAFIYLYGGFAGTETDRSQRDIAANPTILDGGGIPQVLRVERTGFLVSAVDGFTVRNGGVFTNGVLPDPADGYGGLGGGIYCHLSSPLIENNVITRNSLGNPFDNANRMAHGGGIYAYMFFGPIRGNTITENELLNTYDGSGGGIYAFFSMPTIDGNIISLNKALMGAAIHCHLSIASILRNTVENNAMYHNAPPYYNGSTKGAVQLYQGEDFLVEGNTIRGNVAAVGAGITAEAYMAGEIRNNLIIDNRAWDYSGFGNGGMGGGIFLEVPTNATEDLLVVNNTVVGNEATLSMMPPPWDEQGGGIAIALPSVLPPPPVPPPAKLVMANNTIAFNSSGIWQYPMTPMLVPTLVNNDVHSTKGATYNYLNLAPGATDINVDPLFVDRPAGNFRLQGGSPCVDAGANAQVPAGLTADFEGTPRIVDGDGNGSAVVDIGAYEHFSGPDATDPDLTITVPTSDPTFATSDPVIGLGGTASDNVGITHVTWSNDRGGDGTCEGTSTWSVAGVLLFPGQNVITVTAHDRVQGGNAGSAVITVTYLDPLMIAGYVRTPGGSGIGGVVMSGLPSNPTTDATGYYSDLAVPAGWSGTVTPTKEGLAFDPPSRAYDEVTADHYEQNFTGTGGTAEPVVTTTTANSVTSTSAASGGTVVSDGGTEVTARGVCWGSAPDPTTSGSHTVDGAGTGSFTSLITGLIPGLTYHVRAYATNSAGTSYGDNVTFTTQSRDYSVPFDEAFGSPSWPADWTVQVEGEGVGNQWLVGLSVEAGGTPNEMRARYQPAYGTMRLVTPPIDTTGRSALVLSFRHFLRSWDTGGVTLRVQTSPDGLSWADESWSVVTTAADIGPVVVRTSLTQNLDRKTTYVAFVIEGDLFYFEDWFIDDVTIGAAGPKVDFNADGQEDILWRYQGTGGRNRVWFLGNTDPGTQPLLMADPQMEINALESGQDATSRPDSMGHGRVRMIANPRGNLVVADPREAVSPEKWSAALSIGADTRRSGIPMPEMGARLLRSGVQDPEHAAAFADPVTAASGQTEIMAATGVLGGADILAVSDLTWQIMGAGDFNNDGKTDILWRYYGTGGRVRVWYMDGTNVIAGADIGSVSDLDWQIVGTGDFNEDGHIDLLWHHATSGRVRVWYLDGVSIIAGADISTVADLNWKIMGTGDFNDDGHVDLLWRHSVSGRNRVWFMDGTSILSGADLLGVTDQNWQIAGTGDYNNDGHVDLIWRYNSTGGYVYIWYLNGTNWIGTEKLIPVADLNWKIVSR